MDFSHFEIQGEYHGVNVSLRGMLLLFLGPLISSSFSISCDADCSADIHLNKITLEVEVVSSFCSNPQNTSVCVWNKKKFLKISFHLRSWLVN